MYYSDYLPYNWKLGVLKNKIYIDYSTTTDILFRLFTVQLKIWHFKKIGNTFILWNLFLYFVLPETIAYTVFFEWSFNLAYNFC